MNTWWNRFVSRARGQQAWGSPSMGSNGSLALLVDPPAVAPESKRAAAAGGGAMAWIKARFSLRRVSARAQLFEAVTKLAHACEVIEHSLARQQTRIDDIATAVQRLATDMASLPSATMEQRHQMELLCETVSAHRGETAQLGALLADVPASLRQTGELLGAQSVQLASQAEGIGRLVGHAGAAERTHTEIRECANQIGRTQEQQELFMEQLVSERRQLEQDLTDMLGKTSRRLTAMVGVAIALATASTAFGVIQLFLKLTG